MKNFITFVHGRCNLTPQNHDSELHTMENYHSLLAKVRLLGYKVSTIFLYILLQTLKSNSPLRLKALTLHPLHGSLTTYNTKDGKEYMLVYATQFDYCVLCSSSQLRCTEEIVTKPKIPSLDSTMSSTRWQ